MIPFILLFIGLLLIFLEFYTPGGILAVGGGLFFLAAIYAFIVNTDSALVSAFFILSTFILLTLTIKFALFQIKKSAAKNSFYLADDQAGYKACSFHTGLIGSEGTALCDLGPSGYILLDGKRYAATCRDSYIDKGTDIIVVGGEGTQLIVKEKA
jgi:membrane-bound ClpP family serine protease